MKNTITAKEMQTVVDALQVLYPIEGVTYGWHVANSMVQLRLAVAGLLDTHHIDEIGCQLPSGSIVRKVRRVGGYVESAEEIRIELTEVYISFLAITDIVPLIDKLRRKDLCKAYAHSYELGECDDPKSMMMTTTSHNLMHRLITSMGTYEPSFIGDGTRFIPMSDWYQIQHSYGGDGFDIELVLTVTDVDGIYEGPVIEYRNGNIFLLTPHSPPYSVSIGDVNTIIDADLPHLQTYNALKDICLKELSNKSIEL